MNLPKCLTTVTPLSKFLAILMFILLPFIGFLLGTNYGQINSNCLIKLNKIVPDKNIKQSVNLTIYPSPPIPTSNQFNANDIEKKQILNNRKISFIFEGNLFVSKEDFSDLINLTNFRKEDINKISYPGVIVFSWSSDEKKVAYTIRMPADQAYSNEVWLLNLDTNKKTLLYKHNMLGVISGYKWSNEGQYLLFESHHELETKYTVINTNNKEIIDINYPETIKNPYPNQLSLYASPEKWVNNKNLLFNIRLDINQATSHEYYNKNEDLGKWIFNVETKQWEKYSES